MITKFRRDKIQKETEIIQAAFCVWYQSSGALDSFVTGGERIKCFVKPISLTLNNARRIWRALLLHLEQTPSSIVVWIEFHFAWIWCKFSSLLFSPRYSGFAPLLKNWNSISIWFVLYKELFCGYMLSVKQLFIYLCIHSFHSFIRSFGLSFVRSFVPFFVRSFVGSSIYSLITLTFSGMSLSPVLSFYQLWF